MVPRMPRSLEGTAAPPTLSMAHEENTRVS